MTSTTNSSYYINGPHGPHFAPQYVINIPDSSSSSIHSGVNSEANVESINVNVGLNSVNAETDKVNVELNNPNNDNANVDNSNAKANSNQNSIPNENSPEKKSMNSIEQSDVLNSQNLQNMITHIDDLATKYDKTIKSLNDTLKNINESLNDTLKNINSNNTNLANRYDNTLQNLNDTLKKSNQIQDKLLEVLKKLVPA